MTNDFLNLSKDKKIALIRKTADKLDVSDMIIEKDFWVCWVLEKIFTLPIKMAFKGGTSLSKVFGLIKRFSEDCDVTVDYCNFKPDLNLNSLSRSQIKKTSDKLKLDLKDYVLKTVLPFLEKASIFNSFDQAVDITLSEDGEQLRFYYPSILGIPHDYLRDHVLIEFGVRNSTEPCEQKQIKPYLSELGGSIEKIHYPQPWIETLSPIRTFWEKATLMHVECHRDRMSQTPERLSRHWYDLAMLMNSWVGEKAILEINILKSVVEHKKAFFNSSYAHYDDCLCGKLCLIPSQDHLKTLEKDFNKMVAAGMFYESPPSFSKIISDLTDLEMQANQAILAIS